MNTHQLKNKIRGSLIGGAIGDALGYPIEFLSLSSIRKKYGEKGITEFSLSPKGKALISDDTQMTLFTANGLLFGVTRWFTSDSIMGDLDSYVHYAYREWFETQIDAPIEEQRYYTCWLRKIPELNVERAPGNTCMSALGELSQRYGVQNDSKGCGGVMRVAPVGLMAATYFNHYGEKNGRDWTSQRVAYLAGACAALTHKHPLGYMSAAFHALLIYKIVLCENPITPAEFDRLCESSLAELPQLYEKPEEKTALEELQSIVRKALSLAESKEPAATVIPYLGQGWVGEETVAIALYCAKKNLNNFEQAVIDAVNHDGDSDSTGSVCGNIIGAIVGYDAIPDYYKQNVELADIILEIADDLNTICPLGECVNSKSSIIVQNRWRSKYIEAQPYNNEQFWLSLAEQLGQFRKGKITQQELINMFPELEIADGWRKYSSIKEAIDLTIPQECPLSLIPKIVIAACKEEKGEVNLVELHIEVSYQPEWSNLHQIGRLVNMCQTKEPVSFYHVGILKFRDSNELFVELRMCIKEGSHGDEDGYDVGSDTWLVGILKEDGTWLRKWYVEL